MSRVHYQLVSIDQVLLEGGVASEHAPLLRLGMASQQSLSTGVASDSDDQDQGSGLSVPARPKMQGKIEQAFPGEV